jgi:hypothetical protein
MHRSFAWVLLLGLASCDGAKDEARTLAKAVDAFRKAPNDQKPELADALEKVPCTDADVCAARDACTKSAVPTAKGIRLQKEVEQGLADVKSGKLEAGSAEAKALGPKLDEAKAQSDQGFNALEDCDNRISRLKLKYSL